MLVVTNWKGHILRVVIIMKLKLSQRASFIEEGTLEHHFVQPPVPKQIQCCSSDFWHTFSNCSEVVLMGRFCCLPVWPSSVLLSPLPYSLCNSHCCREHLLSPPSRHPLASLKITILPPHLFSPSLWALLPPLVIPGWQNSEWDDEQCQFWRVCVW